jgi:hypothetical protein
VTTAASDQQLWDAFVEAKRDMRRRQADFYQQAEDRLAVLRAALRPGANAWQLGAALEFLRDFPADRIPLLPELFGWAVTSERWAAQAGEVIARIPRDDRLPLLEPLFVGQLATAEEDDYPNLASLAARCEAWTLLERLVRQAESHDNRDVRELAEHYNRAYRPMWQRQT